MPTFELRMPSFSPAKDVNKQPLLTGAISRAMWRFITQRLTRAGRWFVLPSIAFASYGGASLQLQGYITLDYVVALWCLATMGTLVFRPRVRLKATHAHRIAAGQILPVHIEIEQRGRLGGISQTIIPHRLPPEIDCVPPDGAAFDVPARGQSTRVSLGLRCAKRGLYRFFGYRVDSGFPIGLLNARQLFQQEEKLIVYPRYEPLARLSLPVGRRYQPGGVEMALNLGESMEFIGNREYREGDSVRNIDWRATARALRPIVREYRDEYFMRVGLVLDTHLPRGASPQRRDAFENAVSIAAAISDFMARQDYLVDLFAAGPNLHHLTAGRNVGYLEQILEILAAVKDTPAQPFETIEPELSQYLDQITTIVCVFLDFDATRQAFIERLRRQGVSVKLVIVRDSRPTLDPIGGADPGLVPILSRTDFQNGINEL